MPETKRKPTPKKRAADKKAVNKPGKTARKSGSLATNRLTVAFVWDMSYSMMSVWSATVEGFNDYVAGLKREEAELREEHGEGIYTRFSLTIFDTVFEEWYVASPVDELPDIGMDRYIPRGSTALYDAVANTIVSTEKRLKDEGVADEKVLVVVMTDGEENSSREYAGEPGRLALLDLIERYQSKGNWTFSFLGANIDAEAVGSSIGIPVGNTASYTSDSASVASASAGLAAATSTRRSSGSMSSANFFAESGQSRDYGSQGGGAIVDPADIPAPVWDPKSQGWSGDSKKTARKARS